MTRGTGKENNDGNTTPDGTSLKTIEGISQSLRTGDFAITPHPPHICPQTRKERKTLTRDTRLQPKKSPGGNQTHPGLHIRPHNGTPRLKLWVPNKEKHPRRARQDHGKRQRLDFCHRRRHPRSLRQRRPRYPPKDPGKTHKGQEIPHPDL